MQKGLEIIRTICKDINNGASIDTKRTLKVNYRNEINQYMKLQYLLLAISMQIGLISVAQDAGIKKKQFNLSENGLAIQGYDPVSYYTGKKPVKGKKELAVTHEGVTYYFSSQANKDIFLKSASAYEPAYGGWCAYAMGAKGEKVSIDPETFKIINNRLYLFYNRFFNNTLHDWNKDEMALKQRADLTWKKIFNN